MNLVEAIEYAHQRSLGVAMNEGGYPDDIDGETIPGYVVTATLDPGKDRLAPLLYIQSVDDFISEQDEWFDEFGEYK